jgi:alcohol dehydrogenase class IV
VDAQDLGYALTQVVHNLGAVSVTGGAAAARCLRFSEPQAAQRRLVWLVLAGWAAQGASGATFGAISYATYGRFPDIHGIAVAALALKVVCAAAGFSLGVLYLVRASGWSAARRQGAWSALFGFALAALTAAAFLRWFS